MSEKPHFIIKRNLQKSKVTKRYFSDEMTKPVLDDVCGRITGSTDYTVDFVDNDYHDQFLENTYNKGRLAILLHDREADYISFSEKEVNGRNSSVQSVPTAFNMYYMNPYPYKKLYYYFLNVASGNPETPYLQMMYRLMDTIGFIFLNNDRMSRRIKSYSSILDIMNSRQLTSEGNRSNNSTYITQDGVNDIQIYGKTYGASKYETSMICYALSMIRQPQEKITLYEVLEHDLKELPASSRAVISKMGAIDIVPSDMTLERRMFEQNDSLRSPRYLFNLLQHIGPKKCVFCECGVPELIQGAHVWPVASIKRDRSRQLEEKLRCAVDGENGLWLCENHHKLFDENLLVIDSYGHLQFGKNDISSLDKRYIAKITEIDALPDNLMTEKFKYYLGMRNKEIAA